MEKIFDLIQPDKLPIDFIIILLVFFAGEFQKRYLNFYPGNSALKTLFVSFLFTAIYSVLVSIAHGFTKDMPLRWFFSYTLATSLYELLLKKFIKKWFPESN